MNLILWWTRKLMMPVGFAVCGGALGWRALAGLVIAAALILGYMASADWADRVQGE